VYPPNDPALFAEADSRSIKVIAPPGRPDLLRELGSYQTAWDEVRSQKHAPNLSFDVKFDGIVPLRPRHYDPGEWEVDVKLSQTPEERVMVFTHAVSSIADYYRTNLP
jgi:hypothetical protein